MDITKWIKLDTRTPREKDEARRTCSWCGYLSPTFETVGKHWYKCKKKMPHPSEAHDGGHDIYRLLRESNFFLGMEFHRGNLYIPKRPRRLPFKGPDIRKIGLYCSTKQELFKATKENAIKGKTVRKPHRCRKGRKKFTRNTILPAITDYPRCRRRRAKWTRRKKRRDPKPTNTDFSR